MYVRPSDQSSVGSYCDKHLAYFLDMKQDLVCSKIINHGLNHGLFSLLFNFFLVKMHFSLT